MDEREDLFKIFDISKPYIGFKDMEIGNYEILSFRFVANQFHSKKDPTSLKRVIMVELQEHVVILPSIFARKFKDDDELLEAVNKDNVKRFLCFKGVGPK